MIQCIVLLVVVGIIVYSIWYGKTHHHDKFLDALALSHNLKRKRGESDSELRKRIKRKIVC
jgi:hypothetical protein